MLHKKPCQFSSVDSVFKMPRTNKQTNKKRFASNAGTVDRNLSNVVEDVFIVMLNVVSECVP